MSGERTRRIIAVFGGHETKTVLDLAFALGGAIAEADQILLTGGVGAGAPDPMTVKNRAINGAGSAPWVGVDRKDSGEPEHWPEPERGLVMKINLGHKRNYLEAIMCDAAIVLRGEEGTTSELTAALSLLRPVAMVGNVWGGTWEGLVPGATPARRRKTVDGLWKTSKTRLCDPKAENHALDTRIDSVPDGLKGELRCTWFDDDHASAGHIVRWVIDALPDGSQLPGSFPPEVDAALLSKYTAWLAKYG